MSFILLDLSLPLVLCSDHDVAVWSIKMGGNATFTLPKAVTGGEVNRSLFFFKGSSVSVAGTKLDTRCKIDLDGAEDVELENISDGDIELLLLQGKPIAEPVASHGPFVMNTRKELEQAFADYRRTQFGGWPWPVETPVHEKKGRFADHGGGGRLNTPRSKRTPINRSGEKTHHQVKSESGVYKNTLYKELH